MTDDPVAVWRAALNDSQHPRHQVAWRLFSQNANPEGSSRALKDQQEQATAWLMEILDTDALYAEDSLGAGEAPANAATLGIWQVKEAVPYLLRILATQEWGSYLYDAAVSALSQMGAEIIDQVIAFGSSAAGDLRITVSRILGEIGVGDERAYAWVLDGCKRTKNADDLEFLAYDLLLIDTQRAILEVEQWMRTRKFSRDAREMLNALLDDARSGKLV
jgi:hypothetical protein